MTAPQTARRAPARAPLVVVRAASNSDGTNLPAVAATAYLVHGKARPGVVLIVPCPHCGPGVLHQHVGAAGTVKRAPCGRGRYLVSVSAVYSGRAS